MESQLRVHAGTISELCLKCTTLATVSKLKGWYRENMVGAISRVEDRTEMMVVGLV